MKLNNIPDWMEQYIPEITDGAHQTKAELIEEIGDECEGMRGVMRTGQITFINNRIALIQNLKKENKI